MNLKKEIDEVPCLDLSGLEVCLGDDEITSSTWTGEIKEKLIEALIEVGFLQVTGHGIPEPKIQQCFASGQRFFTKSVDYKMQFYRDYRKTRCGYVPMAGTTNKSDVVTENFDLKKPPDAKECLDICHACDNWIDKEFKHDSMQLIDYSQRLVSRILLLLGHGLVPDDPTIFQRCFKNFSTLENTSQLRFLRYPAAGPKGNEIPAGALRCGEHTDYGCITLVYMDTCPGLQVFTRSQRYIDVLPKDGAILVNIGDMMQRWTGDLLRSAKHRVVFRDAESYLRERYSLVYFSHPDEKEIISPIIGPNRSYVPVSVENHMNRRFDDTFSKGKGLDETLTVSG